ncbi:MAG: hypothetical protein HYY78_09870 [Betaproteobacteria bacterium]|nr:hypothetical protein [Betaproteobacteria bacterium]
MSDAARGEDLPHATAREAGIGHDLRAVPKRDAALPADLPDRAHQVLVGAFAPGYPVHDDPNPPLAHEFATDEA